jgi:hypothetical protein
MVRMNTESFGIWNWKAYKVIYFDLQFPLFLMRKFFYNYTLFIYIIDLQVIMCNIFVFIAGLNHQNLHFLQVLMI